MKLTKSSVKRFEQDQRVHGTHTALFNWQWLQASKLMLELGVKRVRTTNPSS